MGGASRSEWCPGIPAEALVPPCNENDIIVQRPRSTGDGNASLGALTESAGAFTEGFGTRGSVCESLEFRRQTDDRIHEQKPPSPRRQPSQRPMPRRRQQTGYFFSAVYSFFWA